MDIWGGLTNHPYVRKSTRDTPLRHPRNEGTVIIDSSLSPHLDDFSVTKYCCPLLLSGHPSSSITELPQRLTFILQSERERHWCSQNAPLEVMEEWGLTMLAPTPHA